MKQTNIKVLSFIIIFALLFTGCRRDNNTADISENKIEKSASENSDLAGDAYDDKSTGADALMEQDLRNSELARASKEAYERFLNNQEPVYFDVHNLIGEWNDEDVSYVDRFRKSTPYRFEEVLDAFEQYTVNNEDPDFVMGNVEYAYIDCGMDRIPELCVRIADYGMYACLFNEVYVIKLIDNKLQLCYSYDYGYRTQASINEYGYIVDEGSAGASSWGRTEKLLNASADEEFIFDEYCEYIEYDDFELELVDYSFKPFSEYTDYDEYEKDLVYAYWILDDNGERIEDDSDYPYCEYISESGRTYVSHAELEAMINKQKEKFYVTDEIINGKEPEWTVLYEAPEVIDPVVIENPDWDYYCDARLKEAPSHISLEKISQKANDIIDEDDWFYDLGIEMPDRNYISYNDYYFHLYGDDEYGYYHNKLEISDPDGEMIADLDFTGFYIPDAFNPEDETFVEEAIYCPKIEDGILYISTFHNTYASSAPHNGYIMAIDMNDNYRVLWKTEPLTCNSHNFEIVDDTIICGYGFTNEDDFIYLLDKNTGKRLDKIKVKTSPDYFHVAGDKLYVRTYNTDYVFKINR